MGSSLLITLREGLEAALVISILLTYLVKTDRQAESKSVWQGTIAAVLACLFFGSIVFVLVEGLHGKVEQTVEGTLALAAVIVLTRMIFWMRTNSQNLSAELRTKVQSSSKMALATIAFVAVGREGIETVLFLLSAKTETASGSSVVIGGVLGLIVAIVIGFSVFKAGSRVNLKSFFNVTAILLLMFAAGLAGRTVHEFRELFGFETGYLIESAWSVEAGIWANGGTFYDFMKGLFGWSASPERIRVITYFAYLIPVLAIYRKSSKADKQLAS